MLIKNRMSFHAATVGYGQAGSQRSCEWLYQNFQADAVDMETAAVAQVAYVNQLPFLGFRSLSDLADGSAGPNEILVFGNLAANNAAVVVTAFLEIWSGPETLPTAQ